jgi:hypothetical protein
LDQFEYVHLVSKPLDHTLDDVMGLFITTAVGCPSPVADPNASLLRLCLSDGNPQSYRLRVVLTICPGCNVRLAAVALPWEIMAAGIGSPPNLQRIDRLSALLNEDRRTPR